MLLTDGGGRTIAVRTFGLVATRTPVRTSLRFEPIVQAKAQPYALSIRGCSGLALAPRSELRVIALLESDLPTAPVGPPSKALSVYLRLEPMTSSPN